jgi:predicted permease
MRVLHRLFTRLLNFTSKRRGDERLHAEMQQHLAGQPFLENLLLDVRYALRVLRKSPTFTVVAVITLMLGIGANVLVFGVLNAVLLQSLDVREPQNLYQLRPKQRVSGRLLTTSYPAFEDLRRRSTTFSDMFAMNAYSHAELRDRGNLLMEIGGEEVSANYFDMLGVQPAAGQFFHATDDHGPGSAPYVVLSNDLWRNAFHADRSIVGTTVEMNLHPFTVLGVAPAQFHGTEKFSWPDYWIPMGNEAQLSGYDYLEDRASRLTVIGRLKPGVTAQQATENLNAIVAELAKEYPATDKGLAVRLIHPGLLGDDGEVIRDFLWSVTALALLVLFAACANLGSLFAARAADRTRELALRVALGSSRLRLVRQLLTEALVVSVAGGVAGLVSAYVLLGVLSRWRPSFGGHLAITVDARVYLAGLALTLGTALRDGAGAASLAKQSLAEHEERAGKYGPSAPLCLARCFVGGADRHLYPAGHRFAGGSARHAGRIRRPPGNQATGCDSGRDGPGPRRTRKRRGSGEREGDDGGGTEPSRGHDSRYDERHAAGWRRLERHTCLLAGNNGVHAGQVRTRDAPL